MQIIVKNVSCIVCGAPEVNEATGLLNIRGYKVYDDHGAWSECLLCDFWFTDDGWIEDATGIHKLRR